MAGAAEYEAGAVELTNRARSFESSAYHLTRWAHREADGNTGPFMDPVDDSVVRTIEAFAAAASDLHRLAGIATDRAAAVREHVQAVRWWLYVVDKTSVGETPPPEPEWPYSWSWQ